MGINIDYFQPLYLSIPVVIVLIFMYRKYPEKDGKQKIYLGLRALSISLLMLGLCNPSIIKQAKETATLFVVDLSESTFHEQKDMAKFIEEAIKEKPEEDQVGVVSFGRDVGIELAMGKTGNFDGFQVKIKPNFTNIQQGLIQGQVLLPSNLRKRIVLLTDGKENMGHMAKQLTAMTKDAIDVVIYTYGAEAVEEVQLTGIQLPEKVDRNQIVTLTAQIETNVAQEVQVLVYVNQQLKETKMMALEQGSNTYIYQDQVGVGGLVAYQVEVVAKKDGLQENNQLSAYTMVNDQPNILILQSESEGENYVEILADFAHITLLSAEEAPLELGELLKYDAYILADVAMTDLAPVFVENLHKVVQQQGKGLLVTGGDNSYGLGAYRDTLLEAMLPVNMRAKDKEEKLNLGLLLVIDKSGSMDGGQYGVTKLALAKEAAIRATDILEKKDCLGVIAFDDAVKWVVKTTKVEDPTELQDRIGTIVPGGGTTILPSLKAAVESLTNQDVALKHIILLTDGQAEQRGYDEVLRKASKEGITLSTVAIGEDSDRYLLKYLAKEGGGRYYETDVFTDIPSIFTKETYMAGKKYLNEITFTPKLMNQSPILSGIMALPELDGYIATSMKERGRSILTGPDEDPILAIWQYGLGRTMAWTSDMSGLFTSKWLGWENNQQFWVNSLSWLIQEDFNKGYHVTTNYEAGFGKISITALESEATSVAKLEGSLSTPEGKELPLTIEAVAPGRYEGRFLPEGEGVYLVNVALPEGGTLATGITVGYSPEFDYFNQEGISAEAIATMAQGRVVHTAKEVYKKKAPKVEGVKNLSRLLFLLGLLVFMMEIILRKTTIQPKQMIEELKARRKVSMPLEEEVSDASTQHIDALLKQKQDRHQK